MAANPQLGLREQLINLFLSLDSEKAKEVLRSGLDDEGLINKTVFGGSGESHPPIVSSPSRIAVDRALQWADENLMAAFRDESRRKNTFAGVMMLVVLISFGLILYGVSVAMSGQYRAGGLRSGAGVLTSFLIRIPYKIYRDAGTDLKPLQSAIAEIARFRAGLKA